MKKLLVGAGTSLLFSIGLAQPALAATSVTFTAGGTLEVGGVAVPNGTNVNDTTITFTNNYASDVTFTTSGLENSGTACNTSPSTCRVTSGGGTASLTAPGAANAIIRLYNGGNPLATATFFTVNSGGGGGGGGGGTTTSTSSTVDSPQPVLQQVEVPAGGCDAISDPELNIGGAGSGGWGQSWAQWVNSGEGGVVCSRTLVYSSTSSSWIVG